MKFTDKRFQLQSLVSSYI